MTTRKYPKISPARFDAIEKIYTLTIVTGAEDPNKRTFWFGRRDMKDNLRPHKVVAENVREAWENLMEKEGI